METMNKKARRFRFTWNNYTEQEVNNLSSLTKKDCEYITFGFELAPTTLTPHLQGYIEFAHPVPGSTCKRKLDPINKLKSKVSILEANASREANIAYAQKTETKDPNRESPFIELNFRESTQGQRSDWQEMRSFLKSEPDFEKFADRYPEQAIKYHGGIDRMISGINNQRCLEEFRSEYPNTSLMYTWQRKLVNRCKGTPDKRKFIWFADEKGNQGKSWIAQWLVANAGATRFTNAASKDIAHAYKGEPIVIIDLTRSNEERINYSILEGLKDGMLFSPKYNSHNKLFKSP
nr:putative replication associated protein [Crucivirus sp.]